MNYSGNDTLSGINRMWMIFQFLVDKNRVNYNFLLFIRHMEHMHIWTYLNMWHEWQAGAYGT